jgi:hypothetical protein
MNFELLQSQLIPISKLKTNDGQIPDVPKNPRFIKDTRFEKLVKSLQDNPEMLSARELLVYQHENQNIVIGGNMRLRAAKELGYKELPCKVLTDLTSEQIRAIVIKDNVSFGSDDFESLSNEWDSLELEEWGMELPNFEPDIDYSILDDDDVTEQLNDMTNGVKKAIQIEFEADHYEEAYALVKYWRERDAYVGGMIMEFLKAEKEKI